ncbi:MAG TPA: tetratricopeptide repeat protein [Puia sp.]|nr:tetratricopeptide repeat protein [Puia sp.]
MRRSIFLLALTGWFFARAQNPDLDKKIQELSAAIQTNSGNVGAYIARSQAYADKGAYQASELDCQAGLMLDPKNHVLWRNLGYAHYMQSKFDSSVADYKKALRIAPRDTIAWRGLGLAYYYKKEYDSSIKMFDKAISLDEKYVEAYAGRASSELAYDKPDNNQLALQDYDRMIQLAPNRELGWYYRAWLYNRMHQYDHAIADARQALALNPRYSYAWHELALAYYNKADYVTATRFFSECLKYDTSNYDVWNFQGYCYLDDKKYDSALWSYRKMISMQPSNPAGLYWAARVYSTKNNNDSAMVLLNAALQINADYADALNYRGWLYYKAGKFDSAISDYERILSGDSRNALVWSNLGIVHYTQGKYGLAISDCKEALKIDSLNAGYTTNLIVDYMADQKYDKAYGLFQYYREKKLNGYADGISSYYFVKKYIASAEFLQSEDYDHALPSLQTALTEYKRADTARDSSPYVYSMYSNVLATLAFVYQQTGDKEKALEYYKKSDIVGLAKDLQKSKIQRLQDDLSRSKAIADKGPQIQLLSPAIVQGNTVSAEGDGKLFVSGTVQSEMGIDWLRINGNNVTVQTNGYFSANLTGDLKSFVIQAEDKDGRISSQNFQIQQGATSVQDSIPGVASGPRPVFHAVLIACSNYAGDKWSKLPSTIDEANSYKALLTANYGFDKKNILELYDKGGHDILASLSSKLESLNENDNLVVLFAGHGTYRGDGNDRIGYWVPLNANDPLDYISNIKLTELIIGCRAKHILLLSDACYSSAMRGDENGDDNAGATQKYEFNLKSRQVLTSGGLEKVPGNSIFIHMVEKVLRQNDQKYLSVKELYSLIFSAVRNQTNNEPELNIFGTNGNEGGQFYFIRTN